MLQTPVFHSSKKRTGTSAAVRDSYRRPFTICVGRNDVPGFARWSTWFLLMVLLLTLLGAKTAQAKKDEQPLVVVFKVSGPVDVIYPDQTRKPMRQGQLLLVHQVIDSQVGGSAVLRLEDGSNIQIQESTRIEINELLPEEKSRYSISLFFGRMAMKLQNIRGDDVVISPTMVAGVRGTEFAVSVSDDGATVISVDEGTVTAFSDENGVEKSRVSVTAGQEVQADHAGLVLKPRPIQIKDLKDWTEFRQKRLEAIKLDLPELLARLEKDIDPQLDSLDQLSAVPLDQAKVLEELHENLKDLGPKDVLKKAKLTIKTHMEAGNVRELIRRFRIRRMRLHATFARSERFKEVLPQYARELGPEELQKSNGILARITGRRAEVMAREQKIAQSFKEAIGGMGPLLDKFDQFQQFK